MAIPVQFQQFKSAGIYRVVYDKSTVLGTEAELLRLVVGYSPKGPFNIPVYVKSTSEFKALYGDISKTLEKRGCFFHRTAIQALDAGPILCLNLKPFDGEQVDVLCMGSEEFPAGLEKDPSGDGSPDIFDTNPHGNKYGAAVTQIEVEEIYDTTRFWRLEPSTLDRCCADDTLDYNANYVHIAMTDSFETSSTVLVRKAALNKVKQYEITISDWYKSYGEDIPEYLLEYEQVLLSDLFTEVYVFGGQFTKDQIQKSAELSKYFVFEGDEVADVLYTEDIVENPNYPVNDTFTAFNNAYYLTADLKDVADIEYVYKLGNDVIPEENIKVVDGKVYKSEFVNADNTLKENARPLKVFINVDVKEITKTIYKDAAGNEVADAVEFQEKYYAKNDIIEDEDGIRLAPDAKELTKEYETVKPSDANAVKELTKYRRNSDADYFSYRTVTNEMEVRKYVSNAFGEDVDGLDELFDNSASGAVAHYVGCLLPDFVDPNVGYTSIDILFNNDSDLHHMMMSLNDNLLIQSDWALDNYICHNYALKDEADNYIPWFLKGYTYKNVKPSSAKYEDKLIWQDKILNTLTKYKGLRTALLSLAEIDYRYIIDTFETFYKYGDEIKDQLSLLAKEKELCFSILNFPAVSTLCKQAPNIFTKFIEGSPVKVFDVNTVVKNINLPSEANGASFCAFYTPLKFSDGYVDTIVPSAGLVSNLFINKYKGRAAYNIVAGPNYGNVQYAQLVGPDYHYSQDELHIIEPYGVNCMIYRPSFGTFINANQTAKQTPKSALSSVNVRELVIYLQTEIGKILQSYQWEFNNPTTREAIKTKADIICEQAKADGGIQQYLNVMDESNNTPDIIDNEMCVISTHIEPGRGMGKMVHELTIYRTGGMSAIIKNG